MSDWLSPFNSDIDQQNIEAFRVKKQPDIKLFSGLGKEIVNAPIRAGVKVFAAGAEALDQASDAAASLATDLLLPMPAGGWDETKPAAQTADVAQAQDENRRAEAARIADQFTPKDSGAGAQVVGAFLDQGATMVGATVATGNPITGAAVLGGTEGYNAYTQAKQDGIDDTTAQLQGTARAATTMLGAVLPAKGVLSGNTGAAKAADAAATVGLSAAVGAAGRYAEQQVLQGAGYDKQAKQFDPTDPTAIATDLALGLGFWGIGRYMDSRRQLPLEQQDALTQVEAQQQAADVSPVPLDTPNTANRHTKNLDLAEKALISGRPVNVPPLLRTYEPSAQIETMPVDERKKLKYNSPELDAYAAHVEQKYGLPSGVLVAVKNSGERSNSDQVSPAGAQGVMQFIPSTWEAYGKGLDPTDPVHSIDAAGRFWADLIKQYDGNVLAAAAHYNGGTKQGKLVASGKRPSNAETAGYVDRIERHLGAMGKDVPMPPRVDESVVTDGEPPLVQTTPDVPQPKPDLFGSQQPQVDAQPIIQPDVAPPDVLQPVPVGDVGIGRASPRFDDLVTTPALNAIAAGNYAEYGNVKMVVLHDTYDSGMVAAVDAKNKVIGMLDYTRVEDENGMRYNPTVYVDKGYRRQGIASAMYQVAEKHGGAKIPKIDQEGQVRTEDGQAFREGMQAKAAAGKMPEIKYPSKPTQPKTIIDQPVVQSDTQPTTKQATSPVDAPNSTATPEQQAALNLPDDLRIPTGELDADGNPITMTAKEMRDRLEAEKAAIDEQTKANDAAINCALQFGE